MKNLLFIIITLIIPTYLNSAYIFNPQDQKTRSMSILKNETNNYDLSFKGKNENSHDTFQTPNLRRFLNINKDHDFRSFNQFLKKMKEINIPNDTVAEIEYTKQKINHEPIGTIEWSGPTFLSQDLSPKINIDRHHPLYNAPLKEFAARYLTAHNIDTAQR